MSEFKIVTDRLIKALGSYRGRQLTKLLHRWEQTRPEKSVVDSVIGFLQENVLKGASVIGDSSLMPIIKDILDMSNHPVVMEPTVDVENREEIEEVETYKKLKIWYPS